MRRRLRVAMELLQGLGVDDVQVGHGRVVAHQRRQHLHHLVVALLDQVRRDQQLERQRGLRLQANRFLVTRRGLIETAAGRHLQVHAPGEVLQGRRGLLLGRRQAQVVGSGRQTRPKTETGDTTYPDPKRRHDDARNVRSGGHPRHPVNRQPTSLVLVTQGLKVLPALVLGDLLPTLLLH